MQIVEKPIGRITEEKFLALTPVMVKFDWNDSRRRTQKVKAEDGYEFGIRLSQETQTTGLNEGDVLLEKDGKIYVVEINPTKVLVVELTTPEESAKVAYEIGNRHAPTFYTVDRMKIMTPYTGPMEEMLIRLHAHPTVEERKLFNRNSLSTVTSDHSHSHGHGEKGNIVSFSDKDKQ